MNLEDQNQSGFSVAQEEQNQQQNQDINERSPVLVPKLTTISKGDLNAQVSRKKNINSSDISPFSTTIISNPANPHRVRFSLP